MATKPAASPQAPKEEALPPAASHLGAKRTKPVRCIVLHHTGGVDSRAWLTRTSFPNKVSIHDLIARDGLIYRSTPAGNVAWHAGYGYLGIYAPKGSQGSLNDVSIGIELENLGDGKQPFPAEQVDAAGFVIASYWKTYGPLPVLSHALVDGRKNDPLKFDWAALYQAIYRYWQ